MPARSRSRSPVRRREPERHRDRHRDPDRARELDRSRDLDRGRERDPERDRLRERERERRRRDKERRSRSLERHGSGSHDESEVAERPKPKPLLEKRRTFTEEDFKEKTEEEIQMMQLMGFGGFESTKGKKVEGNNQGGVHVVLKRRYRQYMNRKGGFNRPLDFVL